MSDAARYEQLVERLLDDDRDASLRAFTALAEASPESLRPLLAALESPRFWEAPAKPVPSGHPDVPPGIRRPPLIDVLHLLTLHRPLPPDAVVPLRGLLGHPNCRAHSEVWDLLIDMGEAPDAEEFRRRLATREGDTLSVALGVLLKAARWEKGLAVVAGLFEDLVAVVDAVRCGRTFGDHCWARVVEEAATLMLLADRPRALAVLLDERRLHPDYPAMPGILEALVSSQEVVPPEKLRPLLEAMWRHESPYWSFVKERALRLAARVDDAGCRAFIDCAIDSPDAELAAHAVPAWCQVRGLPPGVGEGRAYDYLNVALPAVVRHWSAAQSFIVSAFEVYFEEAVADWDRLPLAVAGMRAAGAGESAEPLKRAADLLRAGGVVDDDPRMRVLSAEFGRFEDELLVKLARLAAGHAEEFRRTDERGRKRRQKRR